MLFSAILTRKYNCDILQKYKKSNINTKIIEMEKKKIFIKSDQKDTHFLIEVIAKQLGLKVTKTKGEADIIIIELKNPSVEFNENYLEELDERPAIILTTQPYSYQERISNHLKEREIDNKKLIVEIPKPFPEVIEEFKRILNK